MPAMLVTRVDISTNESMSIKDLDQFSTTAKVNIGILKKYSGNLIVFCMKCS